MNHDERKELDRIRFAALSGNNSAFLGALLCQFELEVVDDLPPDAGAGVFYKERKIKFNRKIFDQLSFGKKIFVLLHELWHVARLHDLRGQGKNPQHWNMACDHVINTDLIKEKERDRTSLVEIPSECYTLESTDYDPKGKSEEQIYQFLKEEDENNPNPNGDSPLGFPGNDLGHGSGNGSDPSSEDVLNATGIVANAVQQARMADGSKSCGDLTGQIESILNDFLKPKLPWWRLLRNYLIESEEISWSWARPNRRFPDVYFPSMIKDGGRLTHVAIFLDTSGSISDETIKRFNSEVKFIQENLNPEKLTVIEFDYSITKIHEFKEDQKYRNLKIIGRGGTSLKEVYEWIVEHKPTCSIIFSDLYCTPMDPVKTPVIWIIEGDHEAPEFGKSFRV